MDVQELVPRADPLPRKRGLPVQGQLFDLTCRANSRSPKLCRTDRLPDTWCYANLGNISLTISSICIARFRHRYPEARPTETAPPAVVWFGDDSQLYMAIIFGILGTICSQRITCYSPSLSACSSDPTAVSRSPHSGTHQEHSVPVPLSSFRY